MAAFPPFSLVGPEFIVPKQPLEIIVLTYPGRNFVITDTNHTILLKVKPHDTTFHQQLQLLDADDNPIAMLRQKTMSAHSTWNVFKGESKNESDMIFSTRTDHALFNYKLNLNMTLANKTRSDGSCDMRIKGDWAKGNITIYMGNSSTAIAQMHKPQNVKYVKDKFTVTIQPNMDYAGVVALFALADAFEQSDEYNKSSGIKNSQVPLVDSNSTNKKQTINSRFIHKKGDDFISALIYVDDVIIVGNDPVKIEQTKKRFNNEFSIKDLGLLKYFLGIEVTRTP